MNVPSSPVIDTLRAVPTPEGIELTLRLAGPIPRALAWVIDFADIAAAFEPIRLRLDHYYLNEIEGLENPTSEALAKWIWTRLVPGLPDLSRIEVSETCTAGCVYRGD